MSRRLFTGRLFTGRSRTGRSRTGQRPTGQQPTGHQPASHRRTGRQSTGRVVTGGVLARIVLGWGAVVVVRSAAGSLDPPVPAALLVGALTVIVGVIIIAALGVVDQAEHLAARLGDPYGTLVLTLSVVLIEVALIAVVLLGPGDHATIARDSVMAVSMIILNLVIGLSLLVGGLRHARLRPNRAGTVTYLGLLAAGLALTFALPRLLGTHGQLTTTLAVPVAIVMLATYAWFLVRQTGSRADDFREVDAPAAAHPASPSGHRPPGSVAVTSTGSAGSRHGSDRREVVVRTACLVVTVIPILLLAHDLSALLDDGLARLGAPAALAGVLIAVIVFLPESLTSVRAALGGEIQRVSNLCHGALLSTVGLTIPTVLVIGLVTGTPVVLAASPAEAALLAATLGWSSVAFTSSRVTATHGVVHLGLFVVYGVVLFA